MRFFNSQEEAAVQFIRSPAFLPELRRCAIAFFLLIPIGFALCQLFPAARDALLGQFLVESDAATVYSAVEILGDTLIACGVTVLCGAVPFVCLPALALGSNAMMLGGLASWYLANGRSLAVYCAAVLPQGIFEFPAIIVSCACGTYFCGEVTRRLRGDRSGKTVLQVLDQVTDVLAQLIFPVLAAAALAEAFLTPRLVALFL